MSFWSIVEWIIIVLIFGFFCYKLWQKFLKDRPLPKINFKWKKKVAVVEKPFDPKAKPVFKNGKDASRVWLVIVCTIFLGVAIYFIWFAKHPLSNDSAPRAINGDSFDFPEAYHTLECGPDYHLQADSTYKYLVGWDGTKIIDSIELVNTDENNPHAPIIVTRKGLGPFTDRTHTHRWRYFTSGRDQIIGLAPKMDSTSHN